MNAVRQSLKVALTNVKLILSATALLGLGLWHSQLLPNWTLVVVGNLVILTTLYVRDVAARKQLAERSSEVTMLSAELARRARLASIGQRAASVGHELRNPLTAVRSAHAYIQRRIEREGGSLAHDAKMKQLSSIVDREIDACGAIIRDLLDSAHDRPLDLRPCPLGPLVDEAISLVPQRDGVSVKNEVSPEMPAPCLDKDQFRQIIINLLENAVEAVPSERSGVVSVRAEGGGMRPWRITISDNGNGIPEDVASKIFQPLFTTKKKGTGLGLAVVESVVQRHKGTIAVKSEEGRGSTFVIELPERGAKATFPMVTAGTC